MVAGLSVRVMRSKVTDDEVTLIQVTWPAFGSRLPIHEGILCHDTRHPICLVIDKLRPDEVSNMFEWCRLTLSAPVAPD